VVIVLLKTVQLL